MNGERGIERIDTRYEVALPKLGLEKITVKVAGEQTIPEEILKDSEFTFVQFLELEAHFYVISGNVGISALAKEILCKKLKA